MILVNRNRGKKRWKLISRPWEVMRMHNICYYSVAAKKRRRKRNHHIDFQMHFAATWRSKSLECLHAGEVNETYICMCCMQLIAAIIFSNRSIGEYLVIANGNRFIHVWSRPKEYGTEKKTNTKTLFESPEAKWYVLKMLNVIQKSLRFGRLIFCGSFFFLLSGCAKFITCD